MDIAEILTLIALITSLLIAIHPLCRVSPLMWLICLAFGVLSGFREFTILSMVVVSVLMLISVTNDFWLPLLGMKTRGLSCSSAIGTIGGGILGTFLIPIPVLEP